MAFLRIIAGRLKGRRLAGPTGEGVRPTADRLRETLFNVLGPSVQGARVLDAFAGTGALGLEALSRGAATVTFVENERRALAVLGENVKQCDAENACAIIRQDFLRVRPIGSDGLKIAADLVLLDPPYATEDLGAVLDHAAAFVAPGGRVVLEHSRRRESPERASNLTRARVLESGDSRLSFYALEVPVAIPE